MGFAMSRLPDNHSPGAPCPSRRRLLLAAAAWAAATASACSRKEPAPPPAPSSATPALTVPTPVDSPRVRLLMIELPGLVNAEGAGPLADLMHTIAQGTPELQFEFGVQPLNRVVDSVTQGECDVAVPDLRAAQSVRSALPYRQSTAAMGAVSFVYYSNRYAPVTNERVEAIRAQVPFDLNIEGPAGMFEFPVAAPASIESALRKADDGRIDALLWAQDEADLELRRLGLRQIRRELQARYDDVLMLPRGPRGEFLDRILSASLVRLGTAGLLQPAYAAVHRPFDPWQPA